MFTFRAVVFLALSMLSSAKKLDLSKVDCSNARTGVVPGFQDYWYSCRPDTCKIKCGSVVGRPMKCGKDGRWVFPKVPAGCKGIPSWEKLKEKMTNCKLVSNGIHVSGETEKLKFSGCVMNCTVECKEDDKTLMQGPHKLGKCSKKKWEKAKVDKCETVEEMLKKNVKRGEIWEKVDCSVKDRIVTTEAPSQELLRIFSYTFTPGYVICEHSNRKWEKNNAPTQSITLKQLILKYSKTPMGKPKLFELPSAFNLGKCKGKVWEKAKEGPQVCDYVRQETTDPAYPWVLLSLAVCLLLGVAIMNVIRVGRIPVPFTVVLLFLGVAFGGIFYAVYKTQTLKLTPSGQMDYTDGWTKTISRWKDFTWALAFSMSPLDLLQTFLPILIFQAAFSMPIDVFVRSLWSILLMALPGAIIATTLTAVCIAYIPMFDMKWDVALALGATVSATDPVAVVAILSETGAPKHLSVLIEGDSLINDGVAIALFHIFVNYKGQTESPEGKGTYKYDPLWMSLYIGQVTVLPILWGLLIGYLLEQIISRIIDPLAEVTLVLSFAYASFFIADQWMQSSGVFSVVVLGLYMGHAKTAVSLETEHFMQEFLSLLAWIANTLLFIACGVIVFMMSTNIASPEIGSTEKSPWWYNLTNILILYVVVTVARAIVLCLFWICMAKFPGYGFNYKTFVLMLHGALRGVVSLTLGLIMYRKMTPNPNINAKGTNIMILLSGIVVLTLIFNAVTVTPILNRLGFLSITPMKLQMIDRVIEDIRNTMMIATAELKREPAYGNVDWERLEYMIMFENPYALGKEKGEAAKALRKTETKKEGKSGNRRVRDVDRSYRDSERGMRKKGFGDKTETSNYAVEQNWMRSKDGSVEESVSDLSAAEEGTMMSWVEGPSRLSSTSVREELRPPTDAAHRLLVRRRRGHHRGKGRRTGGAHHHHDIDPHADPVETGAVIPLVSILSPGPHPHTVLVMEDSVGYNIQANVDEAGNPILRRRSSLNVNLNVGKDGQSVATPSKDDKSESTGTNSNVGKPMEPQKQNELEDTVRTRILKAQKISFRNQYEHGLISPKASTYLSDLVDYVGFKKRFIEVSDIEKHWMINRSLLRTVTCTEKMMKCTGAGERIPPPRRKCARRCFIVASSLNFDITFMFIILASCIPMIIEFAKPTGMDEEKSKTVLLVFCIINYVFILVFGIEFIIRMTAFSDFYFLTIWGVIDALNMWLMIDDAAVQTLQLAADLYFNSTIILVFKVFRFVRLLRIVRLLRPLLVFTRNKTVQRINNNLLMGYDIGKAYVAAIDSFQKNIHFMTGQSPELTRRLEERFEQDRSEVARALGKIQESHPGIGVAIKTRHASQILVHKAEEQVMDLKHRGLIDDNEENSLKANIALIRKAIRKIPARLPLVEPHQIIRQVKWLRGDTSAQSFFVRHAKIKTFTQDTKIVTPDSDYDGIYIITSGTVKILTVRGPFKKAELVTTTALGQNVSQRTRGDDDIDALLWPEARAAAKVAGDWGRESGEGWTKGLGLEQEATTDNVNAPHSANRDSQGTTATSAIKRKIIGKEDFRAAGFVINFDCAVQRFAKSTTEATCDTNVTVAYLPDSILREGIGVYSKRFLNLSYRMWTTYGRRISENLLHRIYDYKSEELKMKLERGYVVTVIRNRTENFMIDHEAEHVILIYGRAVQETRSKTLLNIFKNASESFVAPVEIPTYVLRLKFLFRDDKDCPRLFVIPKTGARTIADLGPEHLGVNPDEEDDLADLNLNAAFATASFNRRRAAKGFQGQGRRHVRTLARLSGMRAMLARKLRPRSEQLSDSSVSEESLDEKSINANVSNDFGKRVRVSNWNKEKKQAEKNRHKNTVAASAIKAEQLALTAQDYVDTGDGNKEKEEKHRLLIEEVDLTPETAVRILRETPSMDRLMNLRKGAKFMERMEVGGKVAREKGLFETAVLALAYQFLMSRYPGDKLTDEFYDELLASARMGPTQRSTAKSKATGYKRAKEA